jgi:hypothetical protein
VGRIARRRGGARLRHRAADRQLLIAGGHRFARELACLDDVADQPGRDHLDLVAHGAEVDFLFHQGGKPEGLLEFLPIHNRQLAPAPDGLAFSLILSHQNPNPRNFTRHLSGSGPAETA